VEEIKMIGANFTYITKEDIEEVLKLNPKEDDFKSSFVTDGKYIYYVDGYTYPQEIRALDEDEQFMNLAEIAKCMEMTEEEVISYMLKQNKDVDYQNIGDNDFDTEEEVDKWWEGKDAKMIFKIYDEYYGIAELIAEL
jgi:hypothetical protein